MSQYSTANTIINSVAVEVGLLPSTDPVGSTEDTFIQLTALLTVSGQELVDLFPWEVLIKTYSITTQVTDTGAYALPDDWAYMTDQTGWQINTHWPLFGPLSPQQWALLNGSMVTTMTIGSGFRLSGNKFQIWPQPPVVGTTLTMEYINRNWVLVQESPDVYGSSITNGTNIVQYEPILIKKMLKMKWLQAKGMDSTAASVEFDTIFNNRTGKDTGAQILNAGITFGYPYLDGWRNVPFTGYGM